MLQVPRLPRKSSGRAAETKRGVLVLTAKFRIKLVLPSKPAFQLQGGRICGASVMVVAFLSCWIHARFFLKRILRGDKLLGRIIAILAVAICPTWRGKLWTFTSVFGCVVPVVGASQIDACSRVFFGVRHADPFHGHKQSLECAFGWFFLFIVFWRFLVNTSNEARALPLVLG